MVFKFLDSGRKSGGTERLPTPKADPRATAEAAARIAKVRANDLRDIDSARQRLHESYQQFLGQLNSVYGNRKAEQRARIEANYELWAAFYELMKSNFKDLWDFLGVVGADVEGWHRISPTGSNLGYMAIGREGYSFAAGVEQNVTKGAPYPEKWLTVTLAQTVSYPSGIGDERMIGRVTPIDDRLVGFARCTGKSGDAQEKGSDQLREKALAYPIVFTLFSEAKGQHKTEVPVSALEKFTLTQMVQPLLVALTNDDMKQAASLLPTAERLAIGWDK